MPPLPFLYSLMFIVIHLIVDPYINFECMDTAMVILIQSSPRHADYKLNVYKSFKLEIRF